MSLAAPRSRRLMDLTPSRWPLAVHGWEPEHWVWHPPHHRRGGSTYPGEFWQCPRPCLVSRKRICRTKKSSTLELPSGLRHSALA